ncbi:phage tail tape measure protein [Gracilibacillus thailandensis]|uniref:Phage tail tape measure protein n=1 Tax=Gracilibacillus thailandensis TaxID=563735 RepID=A0A6N7QW97_9BACI|nr:phage tail tape measure protein [Gracilibacillus thailandensis]MRI65165.1 phage tail tape measure protein [Gracilibacillus thailandensis]
MAADGKITIDTKVNKKGAEKGVKSLQKSVEGSAKKMQKVGGQMTKYITAPLVALGAAGFAAANDIDKAYGKIQTGTGATGEALESLKEDFKEVFSEVPDSADLVADSLATLNTLTGATGETLQNLTENVLDASRSLGEDGVANSEAFGKALAQWQIPAEDGSEALDGLFKLTQDYGVGLQQISSHLTEYGSVLNNAGFSMEESAELMSRLEANGISVSRIMPGLNMGFRKWAEEGKNAQEELEKTIDSMKSAETETEQLTIATEAFGAEGAQRLMTAIRNGTLPALDDLGKAMEDSKGAVEDNTEATETFGDKMGTLKNKADVSLAPLGDIFLNLAENAIPPLLKAVESVAEWFQNLSPTGQKVVVVIGAIIAILPPLIMLAGSLALAVMGITWPVLAVIAGIAALIAIGVALWANWDTIKEYAVATWTFIGAFFSATWEIIKTAFKVAIDFTVNLIKTSWEFIKTITSSVWNGITAFFTGVWDAIKALFMNRLNFVKSLISSVWNTIKSVTSSVWNGIKSTITGIWDGLKSSVKTAFNFIKDTISGVWDSVKSSTDDIWNGITDSVKGAINGVIGAINGMIDALNGLNINLPKIPDWVPGMGGKGGGSISFPNIPNIPSLDVGTDLVTRDGLAMIHAGEKIVPAEHAGPYQGDGGMDYDKLGKTMAKYLNFNFNMNGRTFATAVNEENAIDQKGRFFSR